MGRNHLLDQYETHLPRVYQPWPVLGHLNPGEPVLPRSRVPHVECKRQTAAADKREWVGGVHNQGRQHWEDCPLEVPAKPRLGLPIKFFEPRDPDAPRG